MRVQVLEGRQVGTIQVVLLEQTSRLLGDNFHIFGDWLSTLTHRLFENHLHTPSRGWYTKETRLPSLLAPRTRPLSLC
jgi:hypothetical protein